MHNKLGIEKDYRVWYNMLVWGSLKGEKNEKRDRNSSKDTFVSSSIIFLGGRSG